MFSNNTSVFRAFLTALAATAALALLAGCGGDETTSSDAAAKPAISDAWARTTAEAAKTGAIYMTIKGEGLADRLVGASVPGSVAGETQIHEVTHAASTGGGDSMSGHEAMSSGEMMMREVDGIDIPAGGTVTLKPGGYHVMLMMLKDPIKEGDEINVTLKFEQAGEITVTAVARKTTS